MGNTFITLYDNNGNVNGSVDAYGRQISQTTYNSLNLPLTVTDALGKTTTYTYNTLGKVSSVTGSMNHRTEYNYDGMGRLIAESTCSGGESGKIYSMTTKADRPEPFEAGEFENKEQMLI